jgi:hypothetical protein
MTDERLPLVAGLNELRFLQLGDTKVTDAGLKYLRGLTLLTDLDLSHTRVTDNGLADIEGLTHLESLQLQYTTITDAGLEHLRGLSRLEDLFLQNTGVTDAGVTKLKKALPNLRAVYSHELATGDNSPSGPRRDGETLRYVLVDRKADIRKEQVLAIKLNVFAIDAGPAMELVGRWIARNRDALDIVNFSKGRINMPLRDQVVLFKKGGGCVRYTLRNNIYTAFPRSYDDTIEEVLTGDERTAIEQIFGKHGKRLDKIP